LINLIKNELNKVFKKKTIYIMLVIFIVFALFNVIVQKYSAGRYGDYVTEEYEVYKAQIERLDPNNAERLDTYIDVKASMDFYEIVLQYEAGTWRRAYVASEKSGVRQIVMDMTRARYLSRDEEKYDESKSRLDKLLADINVRDWDYIMRADLEQKKESLAGLQASSASAKLEIANAQVEIDALEMRLKYNIPYGDDSKKDYRAFAINDYISYEQALNFYTYGESGENANERELAKRTFVNQSAKARYIVETGDNLNEQSLRTIVADGDFMLLIILLIVMVAGVIVCDEFNKGTIKLLLIRPHSRAKILLSKYVASLIMIVVSAAMVYAIHIIIGGIFYGFGSLNMPVVNWNFADNSLSVMHPIAYLLLKLWVVLPKLILVTTIAFTLSALFNNGTVATLLALLASIGEPIVELVMNRYDLDFMRYFITTNWDFSSYLFGGQSSIEGMTMGVSLAICAAYLLVMMIVALWRFQCEDIKNI
jgi:ABC-type transport system involved in multi-copper enzyme maturation permease subunit